MYALTLEINQICNLKCSYCYLGVKSGSRMEWTVAKAGIDQAFQNTQIHKDKTLWIDFIGGEPVLDFELIKKLVCYIEKKNKSYHYRMLYSMTTNATLLSYEKVNYLIEKQFGLKISIDGRKEVNDLNRISPEGYSVHDRIMENMDYLNYFEEKSGRKVQVTNVITHNNYIHYYETLKYLTDVLGLSVIDTAINTSVDWNMDQIMVLEENIEKCFTLFIDSAKGKKGFRWNILDELMNMEKTSSHFFSCGAGIISAYIRTDGSIFACPGNLREYAAIGSIKNGYDKHKIRWLKTLSGINNEACNQCEIYHLCREKSCIMQNALITGDYNVPVPVYCHLRKFMYRLYCENKDVIHSITLQ